MKFVVFIFLLKFFVINCIIIDDDEVVKFIKSHGYNGEAHQVITEDGYILRIHHVYPKNHSRSPKNQVLLVHSAFSSSFYFLNSGLNISIGFYLADNGYDVWLGNVRGSKYSTAHKWLPTESSDYWKFSFHEMGVFDLPPMIDYVMNAAGVWNNFNKFLNYKLNFSKGSSGIFYIGHAQSGQQLLALLSLRPEYNEKIIQSHLFGAVGAISNPRPPVKTLIPIYFVFLHFFKDLPYVDLKALNVIGGNVSNFLCTQGIRLAACQLLSFMAFGGDPRNPFKTKTDPVNFKKI